MSRVRNESVDAVSTSVQLDEVRKVPNCVSLNGEITIYQVAKTKQILQEALVASTSELTSLRIDLSAVTECDGAGLQLLLALAAAARNADVRLELKDTPLNIAAIFDAYGVAEQFIAEKESA